MFQRMAFSIHRPSKKLCRFVDQIDLNTTLKYPMSVNHYLGSWERYASRPNDSRRSKIAYEQKALVKEGRDDWMNSWIEGFIDSVEPEVAKVLLQRYR